MAKSGWLSIFFFGMANDPINSHHCFIYLFIVCRHFEKSWHVQQCNKDEISVEGLKFLLKLYPFLKHYWVGKDKSIFVQFKFWVLEVTYLSNKRLIQVFVCYILTNNIIITGPHYALVKPVHRWRSCEFMNKWMNEPCSYKEW